MANKTTNYKLTKPLESEFYDVGVQNENMDKIDTQMKANADAIEALQKGQSGKADLVDGKVPAEQLPNMNYANSYEQNYQAQYDYYKAGNSRVAYNHSAVSTAVWWWLRSPFYYNYIYFQLVGTDGNTSNYYAHSCAGVRPGFAA